MQSGDSKGKSTQTGFPSLVDLATHDTTRLSPPLSGGCLEFRSTPLPRAKIRWGTSPTDMNDRWLPVLHGIVPQPGDVVLLLQPANMVEPIVVGIIDRLQEPPAATETKPPMEQPAQDAQTVIASAAGDLPVEIVREGEEVVLRLGKAELRVDLVTGRLQIAAKWLELLSQTGSVEITSEQDVVIRGNIIHLN